MEGSMKAFYSHIEINNKSLKIMLIHFDSEYFVFNYIAKQVDFQIKEKVKFTYEDKKYKGKVSRIIDRSWHPDIREIHIKKKRKKYD